MGFGDAYTRLRCDQEDGEEEKDGGFLLDNGNCFPLQGLFAGDCALPGKSIPSFVKESEIITLLSEKITLLKDIFGGGSQTLRVHMYMYMYLQFLAHSYLFYPYHKITGISVYRELSGSQLPWKQ